MLGPIFFFVKKCEDKKAKKDTISSVKPKDNVKTEQNLQTKESN